MSELWTTLTSDDLETEWLQSTQEGKDAAGLEAEFRRLQAVNLNSAAGQQEAEALLNAVQQLPLKPDFQFAEPNSLEEIRALRPPQPVLPKMNWEEAKLRDQLEGAWLGRCAGCLLGKPVEGWRRPRMNEYLKGSGAYPLNDYFRYSAAPPAVRDSCHLHENENYGYRFLADFVQGAPEDDDTNYTVTALAVLKRFGPQFTSADVGRFWLENLPMHSVCTAERVAWRNLSAGMQPPISAACRNPYREWIGAQIRADFWGYAAAGNPQLAAEFAWRDASVSHVKNGIYGAMWVAAMTAAAFVVSDIPLIIQAGMAQIPERCRLSDNLESILEWHDLEIDYDTAVYRVHEMWDENRAHDWCHTISNALLVAIALLWGENDYSKTICRAVQPCFDTDCNGATTGSLLGILTGGSALPARWLQPLQNTLHTGVRGYETVQITQMAQQTLECMQSVRNFAQMR